MFTILVIFIAFYSSIFTLFTQDPKKKFHKNIIEFEADYNYKSIVKRKNWLINEMNTILRLINFKRKIKLEINFNSESINAHVKKAFDYNGYKYYIITIDFGTLRVYNNKKILCMIFHEIGHIINGDCDQKNKKNLPWYKKWKREFLADELSVKIIKRYYEELHNMKLKYSLRCDSNNFGIFSLFSTHPETNIRNIYIWYCEKFK